jgi:hypothetical protein
MVHRFKESGRRSHEWDKPILYDGTVVGKFGYRYTGIKGASDFVMHDSAKHLPARELALRFYNCAGRIQVNDALEAYDLASPNDRKTWELIFGNTQNGINWANSVLFYRKQQPLYCPPNNFALTAPQVIEMLRELAISKPKLAKVEP